MVFIFTEDQESTEVCQVSRCSDVSYRKVILAMCTHRGSGGGLKAETLVRNPRCNPWRGSEPIPEYRDCLKGTSSLRSHCGFATLDSKEIKPVNPKGNQSWMSLERIDAEVEAPILWPPDAKSWPTGKGPDVGKAWGQKENGVTEMVEWHHWLNGLEFEQTLGDSERQGRLACCSPWGHKESEKQ